MPIRALTRPVSPEPAPLSDLPGRDSLFLLLVVLYSIVPYLRGLGFYEDDWALMGILSNTKDSSFPGLLRTLASAQPFFLVRPVHMAYSALLYWMFGLHPLGYHLVNTGVFASMILLFHRALDELGLDREIVLSVPLIYALLPHYSTDRFWLGTFQANLSLALYFLSLTLGLRAIRPDSSRRWGWGLGGLFSALASLLAYEVVLPLFALNLLLLWLRARRGPSPLDRSAVRRFLFQYLAGQSLVLMLLIGYKRMVTDRLGIWGDFLPYVFGLAKGAVGVNFFYYGVALPQKVWRILRDYPDARLLTATVLLGAAVYLYLLRTSSAPESGLPDRAVWIRLGAAGFAVFGLGYAVFLTTSAVGFTTTGTNNRTAIAASIGVAMVFVAAAGYVSSIASSPAFRRRIFSSLLALLAMSGFLIVNATARFWITAWRQQQQVIARVQGHIPTLPSGTTLFLDGLCPFTGPAIVFDCTWDATGMLQTQYHDISLQGDVVRPAMTVEDGGLRTRISGPGTLYPYGPDLLLYNFVQDRVYPMENLDAAQLYFRTFNPDHTGGCPEGGKGRGVFVW